MATTATLAQEASQALVDASARRLLADACAPVRYDAEGLSRAVAGLRALRPFDGATQDAYDGRFIGLGEGRTFTLEVGPGVARLTSHDATRRERALDRERGTVTRRADLGAVWLAETGAHHDPAPVRQVREWSRKSRARMVAAFGQVDFSPLAETGHPLGMLTLTYPGDWLAVAPTGRVSKRHLAAFRERWKRALGWRLDGAWKLEFQRPRRSGGSEGQEAPHYHLLAPIPALVKGERFESWLSRTWADVVGADVITCLRCGGWDGQAAPGLDVSGRCQCEVADTEYRRHLVAGTGVDFASTARMSDVKRCATYFLKHGTKAGDDKEYQHNVPAAWQEPGAGPGRFWGFWGLPSAMQPVALELDDYLTLRRTLRRVARARARSIAYDRTFKRARAAGLPHDVARHLAFTAPCRRLRSLGVGGQLSGGFVMVNDGPRLAADLLRAVQLRRSLF